MLLLSAVWTELLGFCTEMLLIYLLSFGDDDLALTAAIGAAFIAAIGEACTVSLMMH